MSLRLYFEIVSSLIWKECLSFDFLGFVRVEATFFFCMWASIWLRIVAYSFTTKLNWYSCQKSICKYQLQGFIFTFSVLSHWPMCLTLLTMSQHFCSLQQALKSCSWICSFCTPIFKIYLSACLPHIPLWIWGVSYQFL